MLLFNRHSAWAHPNYWVHDNGAAPLFVVLSMLPRYSAILQFAPSNSFDHYPRWEMRLQWNLLQSCVCMPSTEVLQNRTYPHHIRCSLLIIFFLFQSLKCWQTLTQFISWPIILKIMALEDEKQIQMSLHIWTQALKIRLFVFPEARSPAADCSFLPRGSCRAQWGSSSTVGGGGLAEQSSQGLASFLFHLPSLSFLNLDTDIHAHWVNWSQVQLGRKQLQNRESEARFFFNIWDSDVCVMIISQDHETPEQV